MDKPYRFEKKFWIEDMSKSELEHYVKYSPALFSEIFYERVVNNIYFDTPHLRNYHENVSGGANRTKVRIRWYDKIVQKIEKPILEFKIKRGELGRKESFQLKPFEFNNDITKEYLRTIFINSNLPDAILSELLSLEPVLVNSYTRKYFMSENKKYRTTIDSNLNFYKINNLYNNFKPQKLYSPIILELKYDLRDSDNPEIVSQGFPFRVTKSSKYVTGINLINQVGY